ncbi:MAG: hypothetical protein QUS11_03940, partial [Candidatus Fermentibacter sp.]|nr:hypothetical protein [Candidatus Fermentibacter sp.]
MRFTNLLLIGVMAFLPGVARSAGTGSGGDAPDGGEAAGLPVIALPAEAESALVQALDTLGLVPAQMDFDRNWSPSVALPDSTAILCLQDISAIPGVLAVHVARASALLGTAESDDDGALRDLVSLVDSREEAYRAAYSTLEPASADTLAGIAAWLWADSDNPGPLGEWGAFHESRGLTPPAEFEGDPDTLALWLERWPVVEPLDPSELIALA